MGKRVFLIVLDSLGIGALPDAADFGDEGSNTLAAIRDHVDFDCPNLTNLGLFNIEAVGNGVEHPRASFARMREKSIGKDTTIGHFEIAGIISEAPLPTYPDGFPEEVIAEFEKRTGYGILCNRPYSGTEVIRDYGNEHLESGKLIVYTSADSVFQIAAHEDKVPLTELYRVCEIARGMLKGKHGVGRVIARPFAGEYPFYRTPFRHDYSIEPAYPTLPDLVKKAGYSSISVGKIFDIFAGRGFTKSIPTPNNEKGMEEVLKLVKQDFAGLCFVNLVDFDMLYGHRNDVAGYAAAMSRFDKALGVFLPQLRAEDVLLITADHGCDPATPSTDHSREYTPMLIYAETVKPGIDLGTRESFADIGKTIADILELESPFAGESFWDEIRKG